MSDTVLALSVAVPIVLIIAVLAWRSNRTKNPYEWHRDPRYWRANMRRKLPNGSFVYREETGQEGKEDQETNAW